MKTPGQALAQAYPDEFDPERVDELDSDIERRLLDPAKRDRAIQFLREKIDFGDPNVDVATDSLRRIYAKRFPPRPSKSEIKDEMTDLSRGSMVDKALAIQKKAEDADDELVKQGQPKFMDKAFVNAFTPDEIESGDYRVRNTFKTFEEALDLQKKHPNSRLVSDGVRVQLVDDEGNTIAQGADDFVSFDQTKVDMSAASMPGRAAQRLFGAFSGQGDPLIQQPVANLLDNLSRGPDPTGKATWRPGFGYPELGLERGRQLGEVLAEGRDMRPVLDTAVKGAGKASEAMGDATWTLGKVKDILLSANPFLPPAVGMSEGLKASAEGEADKKKYDEMAKELGKGIEPGQWDEETNKEMAQDLFGELGATHGKVLQMMTPTGGAKAIEHVVGPLLGVVGDKVVRPALANKTFGITDDAHLMSYVDDAPSIMAVPGKQTRDSLRGAQQTRRTASDVYVQDILNRTRGNKHDALWDDLQNAMNNPNEMARLRYVWGDENVNSAMERLMSTRKGIQSEFAQLTKTKPAGEEQLSLDLDSLKPSEPEQLSLLDAAKNAEPEKKITPLQGEVWTGGRLKDIRPGEQWKNAKERIFAEKSLDENMTARAKDLLQEKLGKADALTTTAETARAEFNAAGGPIQQQMRSLQRSFDSGEIPNQTFSGWLTGKRGGQPPTLDQFQFIDKNIQGEIRNDGKALLLVDDGVREMPQVDDVFNSRRAVFKIPSTGSSELDKSLHGKVVDRPTAQSIYQMSRPKLPSMESEAAAQAWDDLLATSATKEALTRGNPGFDPFQRMGEIVRLVTDSPNAMKDGSRELTTKFFLGELDPKITEAIRRQGSIGYGRTADLLKLGEKEQLLLGEKFVKDQGSKIHSFNRGRRAVRGALMAPGKASSKITDSVVRSLFPDLPLGVAGEDAIRVWHTLSLVQEGVPLTSAIQQTNRLFVNFAEMNKLQAGTAPWLMFVKWQSSAIQGALDAALRKPDRYRRLYDFMRVAESADAKAQGAPVNSKAKEAWQNFAGIPLVEIDGQLYNVKTPGPMTEVGDVMEMAANTLRNASGAQAPGPGVSGLLSPLLRGGYSAAFKKDLATGRAFGLANKEIGENAYKTPAYKEGNLPGLFGIAKLQRDDPENFPADALLGQNPELAALLEYAGAFGMDELPPWALDTARMSIGRTSPWRLDPESQKSYRLRKGLQYGPGVRIAPTDPFIGSMSRLQQAAEDIPALPENLLNKQINRGRIPEDSMSDPNDDLIRMYMERLYGTGNP